MTTTLDQIPCPGGCGKEIHRWAAECQNCGYRTELARFEEMLGSLSMICSILTGFGLASLVTLACGDREAFKDSIVQSAATAWSVAAILFLTTLVMSEFVRRRQPLSNPEEESRVRDSSEQWLLGTVVSALAATEVGIVLLGCYFSTVVGMACGVAGAFGLFVVWKLR